MRTRLLLQLRTFDWQRERFALHIQAARKANLPVIVHPRDANEDTMRILQDNHAEECRFVLHCFCGDQKMAQAALEMGGYISFSGIVTFKNAVDIQSVASSIPLERILVETDCPYLALCHLEESEMIRLKYFT